MMETVCPIQRSVHQDSCSFVKKRIRQKVKAMEEDAEFKQDVKEMIDGIMPMFRAEGE